ncbi:MAG TPA: carboxypeptidase regulatory-like domain-containing protein [Bacteroidia bacterium]|nr:carboxypeptidase regulatory-like domain-containing protein [Bacteroidia bacterium]
MKTINIKTVFATVASIFLSSVASGQESYGEIRGIIKNSDLEPVSFATVKILQGNLLVGGTQSDERGKYYYKPLPPGTYEVIVMSMEYLTRGVKDIRVIPNEATYVDIKVSPNTMETVTVVAMDTYVPPGVDKNMYSMVSLDYKDLNVSAGYVAGNLNSAVTAMTSEVVETKDNELHFRGSRGDANANYVDGVRTYQQSTIPGLAIENITVYTGGVPACYGDVTAGVVIVNTKSYFSGIREKNLRNAEYREKRSAEKQTQKNKEDEENRLKEIEAEKLKTKQKGND